MTIPQKSLIWALITVVVVLLVAGVSAGEGGDHVLELKAPRTDTNVSSIRFYLWTRDNSGADDFEELFVGDDGESILNSRYDGGRKTKVLVHGYGDYGRTGWVQNMRDAYLTMEDCNVISVDWELLASGPNYPKAARNCVPAGARVGELIRGLQEVGGAVIEEDFHTVGYSLGGQMVGAIGLATEGKMKRITSLDPAGFMFHTVPPEERIDASDAEIVDVIHTAGLWLGMDGVVGDIDFYPNGGTAKQPGCEGEDFGLGCSHSRGPDFMTETINSEVGFVALECGSIEDFEAGLCDDATTNLMGEPVDPSKKGTFYLRTNSDPPYAIP